MYGWGGAVSFIVIQLPPGDVATNYKHFSTAARLTEVDAERQANLFAHDIGLDQPMPVQFFNWIKGIVTEGKFGFSFAYRRDVGELIAERLAKNACAGFAYLTSFQPLLG